MIKRAFLVALFLALSLSLTAVVAAQGTGEIIGTLVNGTEGGSSIGGDQNVTLLVSVNGQPSGGSAAKSDAQGKFTFTGLSTDASYGYQVLTNYQGVHYTSKAIAFAEGETSKSADVNVYETTDSDAFISILLGHVVFFQDEDVLEVKEFYLVVNSADRTYTGSQQVTPDGRKQTMSLSLPKGATNVKYTNGLTDLTTAAGGDGLLSTLPIMPGMNGVGYTYELNNSSDKYTFTKKIPQGIAQIDLLAEGKEKEIAGEGLTVEEPLDVQGIAYAHASKQNLAAGDVLTVQLSRLTPGGSQSMVLLVIVALGVLAALGSAGFLWKRRRTQPAPRVSQTGAEQGQILLSELARLDDEFESGKISEQDYTSLRAAKKAQLIEHLQKTEAPKGE
ncbi:MAG: hypothetical protein Q7T04_04225 [Dehalococcoidia bacterium]|nr:hypothetical protein [Dehalococcoidia bacterium]